jgi:hypothetical protein
LVPQLTQNWEAAGLLYPQCGQSKADSGEPVSKSESSERKLKAAAG